MLIQVAAEISHLTTFVETFVEKFGVVSIIQIVSIKKKIHRFKFLNPSNDLHFLNDILNILADEL